MLSTTAVTHKFDSPDADIILLSSPPEQAGKFRVHQCILAAASPFFKDMFNMPQPTPQSIGDIDSESGLAVVLVFEVYTVLDVLLRFVYPIPDPQITDLDVLGPVLGAALKYDMDAVVAAVRKQLVSPNFVRTEPTRVFAIASRYDLEEEAKLASRYTLSVNILDYPLSDDLKYITAYSYHRLLDLHRRRAQAALELLKYPENVRCMLCNGSNFGVFMAPRWWTEFERLAREELSVRPTTDKIFELEFLAKSANASNCQRCPGSVLDSYKALEDLKQRIDDLPSTI